jgi:plastocyanin
MKQLLYIIPLSAMAVLVFATIATAQSVLDGTVGTNQGATQPAEVPAETTAPANTTAPAQTTTPAETTAPAPSGTITVDIRDHAFNPAQLNVAPGTTVTFVNNDPEPHTATADNGVFDTGVLEPGYSFDVFLDGSGTATYHCELHPHMQGSIVVGQADAASGTEGTNPPNQSAKVVPSVPPTSEATEAAQPVSGY